jgi:hypothetical protein
MFFCSQFPNPGFALFMGAKLEYKNDGFGSEQFLQRKSQSTRSDAFIAQLG